MNITIAAYHLLTCYPKQKEQKPQSIFFLSLKLFFLNKIYILIYIEPIILVVAIDVAGVLHIYNSQADGQEIFSHSLLQYHKNSNIVVSDVEGESEEGPILVTGSSDGSLHVLGINVI